MAGNTALLGDASVAGNMAANTLSASGRGTFTGGIVANDMQVGSLRVTGELLVPGEILIGGVADDFSVAGDMSIGGAAIVDDNLAVGGGMSLLADANGDGGLALSHAPGDVLAINAGRTFNNVDIDGVCVVDGLVVQGDTTILGAMNVGSIVTLATNSSVITSGGINVLGVTESVEVNAGIVRTSTLAVGGPANAVEVNASAIVRTPALAVTGATTTNTLAVTQGLPISSDGPFTLVSVGAQFLRDNIGSTTRRMCFLSRIDTLSGDSGGACDVRKSADGLQWQLTSVSNFGSTTTCDATCFTF